MVKRHILAGLGEAIEFGFWAGINVATAANNALCLLPGYERGAAVVLDTIIGPADSFEYVSTTTPKSPPPTIS